MGESARVGFAEFAFAGADLGGDGAGAEDIEEVDGAEVVLAHEEFEGVQWGGGWGWDGAVLVLLAEVGEEGLEFELFRGEGAGFLGDVEGFELGGEAVEFVVGLDEAGAVFAQQLAVFLFV